jgi:aminoglycoside phosphotransferase (APT) family kinase protein
MNRPLDVKGQPAEGDQLGALLESVLGRHFGAPRRAARVTRRQSDYSSSFPLEELDVLLEDGTELEMMLKSVGRQALLEVARRAKPAHLHDPLREIETYRTLLVPDRHGTAVCYGAVADEERGRYWLFLERVRGLRLAHVGEFATWLRVAEYLADMHNSFARKADEVAADRGGRWLNYDRDYYWQWMRRAQGIVCAGGPQGGEEGAAEFERLAVRYGQVIERLLAIPKILIHGEFYAANVLIHEAEGSLRICPVDWEMTATGPGLMDLAALTCGSWSDEQKRELALAYRVRLEPRGGWPPAAGSFLAALELCRLHQAVQWLGWSPDWSAPPQQAWNWLTEALRVAEQLGL